MHKIGIFQLFELGLHQPQAFVLPLATLHGSTAFAHVAQCSSSQSSQESGLLQGRQHPSISVQGKALRNGRTTGHESQVGFEGSGLQQHRGGRYLIFKSNEDGLCNVPKGHVPSTRWLCQLLDASTPGADCPTVKAAPTHGVGPALLQALLQSPLG